jgi:antitoxin Phd
VNVYTYSEARQKLAGVLDQAAREGEARIRRKDGQTFVIQLEQRAASPLDVEGLNLDLDADEIVSMVREGRRTEYRTAADWRAYIEASEGGTATLRGTEVTVAMILDDLVAGPGPDEVARKRSGVTREAVEAAICYAAELVRS